MPGQRTLDPVGEETNRAERLQPPAPARQSAISQLAGVLSRDRACALRAGAYPCGRRGAAAGLATALEVSRLSAASYPTNRTAAGEREKPATAPRRQRRVVRHQQQCRAALAGLRRNMGIGNLGSRRAVEISGRLVSHQHARLPRKSTSAIATRYCSPPESCFGNGPPVPPGRRGQARVARPRRCIERASELEGQHHVLQRRQRGQELERLEHEAEPALPQGSEPIFGELIKRRVADRHFARRRAIEPGQKSGAAWSCRGPEGPTIATRSHLHRRRS